ncbi:hypothetical protein GCM10009850_114830 [Nonomuraea monospora]|uniref:Uncharacterized protein n=1 Tax=Nonomuraea monospora TaxID=568818 RepID=A0ABN3D374_9ACTN
MTLSLAAAWAEALAGRLSTGCSLGAGFPDSRLNAPAAGCEKRRHIRRLQALGYSVTVEPAT